MSKYVNADILIDEIIFNEEDVGIIGSKEAIDIIQNMPSADVAEVKHGEWIEEPSVFPNHPFVRCSECGEEALLDEYGVAKSNFCPNCGADMRGEENG